VPQIEKHLKWCLNDEKRLLKIKPDNELAKKHLKKSEYNYSVLQNLEKLKNYDWALNVGFYAIYHCFLAILSKHGYESRNQSCTITVLLHLIDQKKLEFSKEIVLQFDTLEPEKNIITHTLRFEREESTYGVKTTIKLEQLKKIKELVVKTQRETIKVLSD